MDYFDVFIRCLGSHSAGKLLNISDGLRVSKYYKVHLARDGILHTLVLMSGYLNYCCRSIISNQSAHSLLTSDINNFQPHNCRSLDIFYFLDPSL